MKLHKRINRLFSLLLTLCCAAMLGSCKVTETTTTSSVPGKNTIQPAVLTQAESDLLTLVDVQQPLLFDFSVECASGYQVEIFTCRTAHGSHRVGAAAPSTNRIFEDGLP